MEPGCGRLAGDIAIIGDAAAETTAEEDGALPGTQRNGCQSVI